MQIESIEIISDIIKTDIIIKHDKQFKNINGLIPELDSLFLTWKQDCNKLLQQTDPFINHVENLVSWQRQCRSEEFINYHEMITNFQTFTKVAKIPFDFDFWQQQLIEKNKITISKKDKHISEQLLLKEWQKKLDEVQSQWQFNKLQQLRLELLAKIEYWLKWISSLQNTLELLGFDTGLFLDFSQGELSFTEIDKIKRWAKYLTEDKGAKAICELLGKVKQISQSEHIETIRKTITLNTPYIDTTSKEEIVGLKIGRDIEQVLASELALLSSPDTEILFDLKYIESRLLCFDMQGTMFKENDIEIEDNNTVINEENLGPMILCIDTSGSMQGEPEYIAKAMALYLATQAKSQERACYLINFSTEIETYELTGNHGISRLIQFLSQSFHGGTDVAPALRHALSIMEQKTYNKADVLVISDFIMGQLPEDILEDIHKQRESNNKFNSLVIGNCFMNTRMGTHFDHEWVYNPYSSKIHELIQFKKNIIQ